MKILIIDDDDTVHRQIKDAFIYYDVSFAHAYLISEARRSIKLFAPDLCLLDIMIPGTSGKIFCRELSESHPNIGIIILTSLSSRSERIVLLEMGADDYVVKPFDADELRARVHAISRRIGVGRGTRPPRPTGLGALDSLNRRLRRPDGTVVALTTSEAEVLRFMMDNPAVILTREDILAISRMRQWRPEGDRSVDNLIARLRRKVEVDPKSPAFIRTVWGRGYRFAPDPEE